MTDHKERYSHLCGNESPEGDKCVLYKDHVSEQCQTNHGRKKWPSEPPAAEKGVTVEDLLKENNRLKEQVSILKRGGSVA